jgi:hypothetical protein
MSVPLVRSYRQQVADFAPQQTYLCNERRRPRITASADRSSPNEQVRGSAVSGAVNVGIERHT